MCNCISKHSALRLHFLLQHGLGMAGYLITKVVFSTTDSDKHETANLQPKGQTQLKLTEQQANSLQYQTTNSVTLITFT